MAKIFKKQIYKILDSPVDSSKDVLYEEKNNVANKGDKNNNNSICNSSKIHDTNKSGNSPFSFKLTNQNLMEAIIYSEILGKPKCKSRGGRR
jgi:hypothetical protein